MQEINDILNKQPGFIQADWCGNLECEEKMEKTIEAFTRNLANIRTGRATPAMLDKVMVEYYGARKFASSFNQKWSQFPPPPPQLSWNL